MNFLSNMNFCEKGGGMAPLAPYITPPLPMPKANWVHRMCLANYRVALTLTMSAIGWEWGRGVKAYSDGAES